TTALTMLSAAMGTAALVGIHHRYRKQQQPDASLWDYLAGMDAQLQLINLTPKRELVQFRHACQQAAVAWQQAYRSQRDDDEQNNKSHSVSDFSAAHTTTILPRPVCWVSGVASMPKNIALATEDSDGSHNEHDFGVVGIDADRQIVWQTTMPERVHDIVVQPISDKQKFFTKNHQARDEGVMGRRPS